MCKQVLFTSHYSTAFPKSSLIFTQEVLIFHLAHKLSFHYSHPCIVNNQWYCYASIVWKYFHISNFVQWFSNASPRVCIWRVWFYYKWSNRAPFRTLSLHFKNSPGTLSVPVAFEIRAVWSNIWVRLSGVCGAVCRSDRKVLRESEWTSTLSPQSTPCSDWTQNG